MTSSSCSQIRWIEAFSYGWMIPGSFSNSYILEPFKVHNFNDNHVYLSECAILAYAVVKYSMHLP